MGLYALSGILTAVLLTNLRMMALSKRVSTVNLGSSLLRDVWIFAVISIVVVILRVASKARMGTFGVDDGLIIFAMVSSTSRYETAKNALLDHAF